MEHPLSSRQTHAPANGKRDDLGASPRRMQLASNGGILRADVSHSNDCSGRRRETCPRYVADLLSLCRCHGIIRKQLRPSGDLLCPVEPQSNPYSVHMPPRTHALHNFLPGVTAFGVADMCILQAGFMRNLLLIEVVAKPGDARLEPQDIQGLVANRPAALQANRLAQNPPQLGHAAAFHKELAARHSAR